MRNNWIGNPILAFAILHLLCWQADSAAGSLQQQAAPPTAAAPAAQAPQAEAAVPIALHLENADLLQVIAIIAAELNINYVVDPEVSGTVNINTLGELRRSDLFPLLQTILRINGATAVQSGNVYRIVPLQGVQRLPLEPMMDPQAADLPADDRMVMNIIPLRYFLAADMTRILTPFLSEGGHLLSLEQGNILIITDSSQSMRRLLGLVALLDTETFVGQRVRLYPIRNSQADRVASEMSEVFAAYAFSEESSGVRFVPMERINSILVVAANPNVFGQVEQWLQRLDRPVPQTGVRPFIYKVENGKAEDLASVLTRLLAVPSFSPGALRTEGQQEPASAQGATGTPTPFASPAATIPGPSERSHIRIVPDPINNQIVVMATAQEYEQIRQTLQDLDIVPRQVMIEAKVYEVNLTDALSAGVSAFLQNRTDPERARLPGDERKLQANFNTASALTASIGTLVGKTRELLLFLNAAEERNEARVISAPSILATDNIPASISVGTEIPILTSQALVGGAQADGTNLFTNTVQNRDTGVLLTITPRINSSGLVNMEIQQEVSSPLPASGPIQSPSIQKRSVATQAVVQNGETIALGGIIQEDRTLSKNRIPLLGDIPYLGVLFGNTSVTTTRTELIILLTPTVIRNRAEARRATTEFRDKLRELRKVMEEEKEREEEEREKQRQQEEPTSPSPAGPEEDSSEPASSDAAAVVTP